jgi:hypothetical protein
MMNTFVLKNLRKRYSTAQEGELVKEEETVEGSLLGLPGSHYSVTINFNKFEKPVGAVVLSGGQDNIKDITDIIEIKK